MLRRRCQSGLKARPRRLLNRVEKARREKKVPGEIHASPGIFLLSCAAQLLHTILLPFLFPLVELGPLTSEQ